MTAIERTPKREPREVIQYEIDMLRFCYGKWSTPEKLLRNLYVEGYLLHYRCLLEFFGRDRPQRPNDLCIGVSGDWATRELTPAELDAVLVAARALDAKWWKSIGRYLAHTTHPRYEEKQEWPIEEEMHPAMEKIIESFLALGVL